MYFREKCTHQFTKPLALKSMHIPAAIEYGPAHFLIPDLIGEDSPV